MSNSRRRPSAHASAASGTGILSLFHDRPSSVTFVRTIVLASVVLVIVRCVQIVAANPSFIGIDAYTYMAAGERLNAGHALYALSTGDRPVVLMPPYWTVPLLYPPFIAVVWRPLAVLSGGIGLILWWAASIAVMAWGLAMVTMRPWLATALIVALLSSAVAAQVLTANVDAWILVAMLLIWRMSDGRHERGVGVLVALIIAVKLTPVAFAWWLFVGRRWSALRWMGAALALCGLVSILGAGLGAHFEYLRVLTHTSISGATPSSLAGIAASLRLPPVVANGVPLAALAASLIAMLILRDRPTPVFVISVVASVFRSPVVSGTSQVRLLAVLAPAAFPHENRLTLPPAAASGVRAG